MSEIKRLLTLTRKTKDFEKYLDGSFSNTDVALVLETHNLNSLDESITFEIKNEKDIKKPHWLRILFLLAKPHKFIFLSFPVLFILLNFLIEKKDFDSMTVGLSLVASIFLFLGINLMSDYNDHIRGFDRINDNHQSRPILLGWLRPFRVKQISWLLMIASLLLSLPVIIAFPKVLIAILSSVILIFLGLLSPKKTYRDFILGDVFWGLLIGPILSIGLQAAFNGSITIKYLFFGVVWGSLIFFRIQVANFEHILSSSLAKVSNSINVFGFESSKKFLIFNWIFFLFLFSLYQSLYQHWLIWFGTVVILLFQSLKEFKLLLKVPSPSGSEMKKANAGLKQLFILAVMLWLVQITFQYLMILVEINHN